MEDFAIPEEYYTCPADSLFDLLADSLLTFAKRLGWWAVPVSTFGSALCLATHSQAAQYSLHISRTTPCILACMWLT